MLKSLGRLVNIQPDEVRLFLWSAALLFLIRTSNIIFNNFGETVFLKRFGVEYLPTVYMVNAIITFFIMGAITGFMRRMPSSRLLAFMLFACGASLALLRIVVGLDFSPIYPVLFLLKAQYEALLALVFWNLANDLFNTRQSKRLFPLITAGGVLGAIAGSFGTPWLSKAFSLNNLMLVYFVTTGAAAAVVWRMDTLFPTLPLSERKERKGKGKKKESFITEIKGILPMMKESTLLKIVVLITFLPNILIPIMNYQFNFAVNEAFKTEGGLVAFFGFFRGALNIISFVLLMFTGKMYTRWGLPVALMFHPCNYVLAFLAFLLKFDVFSAIYARISTNVIRTVNNPARDILMGLFPIELRSVVRPFLRGTVVRIAILLGSGFTIASQELFEPRYLSIVGILVGLAWVLSSIWLKKSYSGILLDLVSRNVIDLKSLEEEEVTRMFQDKQAQSQLVEACLSSNGQTCVWYADIMKAQGIKNLDEYLLTLLREKDTETVIELLPLVPPEAGPKAIKVYRELADPDKPALNSALAQAASQLPPEVSEEFLLRLLEEDQSLEVQAHAVTGLYTRDEKTYFKTILSWLESANPDENKAGVIAAGGSGNQDFIPRLKQMLVQHKGKPLERNILMALHQLGCPELKDEVLRRLETDPDSVPLEVIEDFPVDDDESVKALIRLLGHPSVSLNEIAQERLREAADSKTHLLIESLAIPNRKIREGLYSLLEDLRISDREIIEFARLNLKKAYFHRMEVFNLNKLDSCPERDLLTDHLRQKQARRLETILRVLATQDGSGQMRIILRGLYSADTRLRSNAIEALETMVGSNLAKAMIPLLEDVGLEESVNLGQKLFDISRNFENHETMWRHFLGRRDWVTLVLTLTLLIKNKEPFRDPELLGSLSKSENSYVRSLAERLLLGPQTAPDQETSEMQQQTSLSEKILLLRGMEIFKDLPVGALAAIATLTEEEVFSAGSKIIQEGEMGDTLYLIVSGEVSVHKSADDGCEVQIDNMSKGEYFGEMALFEDQPRSATCKAENETRLLVLHQREFAEAVQEYPQIALQICQELSRRIRHLHQKIQSFPVCELEDSQPSLS